MVDVSGNVNIDSDEYRVEGSKLFKIKRIILPRVFGSTKVINKRILPIMSTQKRRYNMNSKKFISIEIQVFIIMKKMSQVTKCIIIKILVFRTAKGNVTLNSQRKSFYKEV